MATITKPEPDTAPSAAARRETSAAVTPAAPQPGGRRRLAFVIMGVVLAGLLAVGAHRWWLGRTHVTTDDAQVDGHIIPILPKVGGFVAAVRVIENQHVRAGDTLVGARRPRLHRSPDPGGCGPGGGAGRRQQPGAGGAGGGAGGAGAGQRREGARRPRPAPATGRAGDREPAAAGRDRGHGTRGRRGARRRAGGAVGGGRSRGGHASGAGPGGPELVLHEDHRPRVRCREQEERGGGPARAAWPAAHERRAA